MTGTYLLVAGARPNFMKVAPILAELEKRGAKTILVHTGQHFDHDMSDTFFRDLGIREPDFHLQCGGGTHTEQTSKIMAAFEPVLRRVDPDWVIVVGDVNSTLACALVVAKSRPEVRAKIAHVEAGLRSGDWEMPEEVNRVLTDRLSDLLLTPSLDGNENLAAEGIGGGHVVFVGNVMIDTLFRLLPAARKAGVAERLGLQRGGYAVATIHRPSNVDDAETLQTVSTCLEMIARDLPVVFPMHPRTRKNIDSLGMASLLNTIKVVPPLSYVEMLSLTEGAAVVLTDSGGLQEETTALGVPCVTLRAQTERPITITQGTNRMAPWPLSPDSLLNTVRTARAATRGAEEVPRPALWDGNTRVRIVDALIAQGERSA